MTHGKTFSGIQIGKTAILGGRTYRVIGRVAYKGHDDEDTWIWEEWRLTDGTNDSWLEYEPEYPRFTLFKETEELAHPVKGNIVDPKETGTLTSFEGEIPWTPKIGERYSYTTYQIGPNQLYSVESDEDGREFYLGTILPTAEVKRAFQLPESSFRGAATSLNAQTRAIGAVSIVAFGAYMLALPLLAALEFVQQPIFRATLAPCDAPGPGCAATGTRLGLVEIAQAHRPYAVAVETDRPGGTAPHISFVVRKPDERERASSPVHKPASRASLPPAAVQAGRTPFRVSEPGAYVLEITALRTPPGSTLVVTVEKNAYASYLRWMPYGLYQRLKQVFFPRFSSPL